MNMNEVAKEIIKTNIYLNIATTCGDNSPWNTPVYSAFDQDYHFYFVSWVKSQHAKNIRKDERVFVTIYDSHADEGTGQGVYIKGKAYELNSESEIQHGAQYFYGRKNQLPRDHSELLGDFPRRMYKIIPEKCWVNIDSSVNGKYIDDKVEVELK